jgi:hypothetical protein
MEELTCPNDEVYVGQWHTSDLGGAVYVDPTRAMRYFDQRKLEKEGWIIQRPDALRGKPFSRALHPKAKRMKSDVYLTNTPSSSQRIDGPVVQVVFVPVGDEENAWPSRSWGADLQHWYNDDTDLSGRFCCGVLFIKSDH